MFFYDDDITCTYEIVSLESRIGGPNVFVGIRYAYSTVHTHIYIYIHIDYTILYMYNCKCTDDHIHVMCIYIYICVYIFVYIETLEILYLNPMRSMGAWL